MAAEPTARPDEQQCRGGDVPEFPAVPRRSDVSVIGPPESLNPAMIYKLYRGTVGEIDNYKHRVWAEWPSLQLCWARSDQPAHQSARVSLDDLSVVECKVIKRGDEELVRVDVFRLNPANNRAVAQENADQTPANNGERQLQVSGSNASIGAPRGGGGGSTSRPTVRIVGTPMMLVEFAEALQRLLQSRESDGRKGLEFVQRRLFQYLWNYQGNRRQAKELLEAQAVLAFNLEPRDGVAYLRTKLENIRTDEQVGEWLAKMSAQTGGLDPTMLGAYFSRRDTGDVFKAFVRQLDFSNMDIDEAVRKLFDTFKPGGEGQVITRILELFAEAYYLQWRNSSAADGDQNGRTARVAYKDSDGVFQVAVSLIMLNTGLHVATKKVGRRVPGAAMTVEEYITNVRRLVSDQDVPDDALKKFYDHVKAKEISVEPLPRASFAQLPVQPDIEGWLVVLLEPGVQRRYWAVLALRRMYLFSDASEMEPGDAIDLKDTRVRSVSEDGDSKARFLSDVETGVNCCVPVLPMFCGRNSRNADILDADAARAFELVQLNTVINPSLLGKLSTARHHLFLVAETPELMEKWVSLIETGPY